MLVEQVDPGPVTAFEAEVVSERMRSAGAGMPCGVRPMYLRRRQPDGRFVSTCMYCHAVLGSAAERSDLALLEALHVCLEKHFLKTFREKGE